MNILVSVIIPTYNEEKYIQKCVQSLLDNQTSFSFEVMVVDGGSTDQTLPIVKEMQKEHKQLKLLRNEQRFAPHAFNIGIKAAKGEFVIILGAHSYVDKFFLQKNYDTIKETEADCVGGRIHSIADTQLGEDIKLALSSPFGVGNALFRYATKPQYVDTVAFGCYNRQVFEKIGLFDEELVRNQDDEFNQRLTQAGGKVFFNPEIISYYFVRSNLKKLFRQYFQYGFWKIIVQKKRKQVASLRHLVPMLFVLFLISGAILSFFNSFAKIGYLAVLLVYLIGALSSAHRLTGNFSSKVRLPLIFFTLHVAYGLGYWKGVLNQLLSGNSSSMKETTR